MGLTFTVARETVLFHGGVTDALRYRRLLCALQRMFFARAPLGGGVLFVLSGVIADYWVWVKPQLSVPIQLVLRFLADVTAHAIRHLQQCPQDGGLYHCVAAGETNWNLYAKEVLAQVALAQPAIKLKATEVAPVPTSAFPTPAARPHNSRLDTTRLQNTFGITLPPWQQGVARMLREIL